MTTTVPRLFVFLVTLACAGAGLVAQPTRIDVVTPIAPELAAYGRDAVGVRTLTLVDGNRADILNTREGAPTARYDQAAGRRGVVSGDARRRPDARRHLSHHRAQPVDRRDAAGPGRARRAHPPRRAGRSRW